MALTRTVQPLSVRAYKLSGSGAADYYVAVVVSGTGSKQDEVAVSTSQNQEVAGVLAEKYSHKLENGRTVGVVEAGTYYVYGSGSGQRGQQLVTSAVTGYVQAAAGVANPNILGEALENWSHGDKFVARINIRNNND